MEKEIKSKKKKDSGITLIALVITIIVLIILAGVSINLVLGNNGIITRAREAKNNYQKAAAEEETALKDLDKLIDETTGSSGGDTTKDITKYQTGETKPYLPDSNYSVKEGSVDTGLVIKDKAGNEYVWVEVPKTAAVYPTAGINLNTASLTTENYTAIENDLKTYTSTYRNTARNTASYSDTYYAASHNAADWFADENAYNTAKQKMLKSVYENGGFWVGRYEAGIEENRTAQGEVTITPLSQANKYPYTHVTRTQAHKLAKQVAGASSAYTSDLMFGVQWDLMLKFIETKLVATNSNIQSNLNTDSINIGNYYNGSYNITNTSAKYSTNHGSSWSQISSTYSKPSNSEVLLTTGASNKFSLCNISDLAGNVWEWTLEYTSHTSYPCARRGGFFIDDGSNCPASYRDNDRTASSGSVVGFRVTLYR